MIMKNHCPENKNIFRGLSPVVGNDAAHKEMYDMGGSLNKVSNSHLKYGLYEETPFPQQKKYQWIQKEFNEQYNILHAASLKLLEYMAIGLGKDRFFFHQWFEEDSLSTFRAIHNIPRSANVVDNSKLSAAEFKLNTPEHRDSGFITILSTFGYPGLQVLLDGEYRSVKPIYNQLVVNIGSTLMRVTNFTMKATYHRVLDIGVERFSSPFFLRPKYSATIPSNLLAPEEDATEPPIVFGPWLVDNLIKTSIEWKGLVVPNMSKRRRNKQGQIING